MTKVCSCVGPTTLSTKFISVKLLDCVYCPSSPTPVSSFISPNVENNQTNNLPADEKDKKKYENVKGHKK